MIKFERFELKNGLKVLVHKDMATPMAVVNVLYDVGARDEEENRTGFAHLFEHLMFGGSINIPDYDEPLQLANSFSPFGTITFLKKTVKLRNFLPLSVAMPLAALNHRKVNKTSIN